ncbi:MAG: DinB family protein, partial [Bacteroidota bacterium]
MTFNSKIILFSLIVFTMSWEQTIAQTRAQGEGQVLSQFFNFQASLVVKNIQDITDEEAQKRINKANSLEWIVGHTLDLHYNLAILLGVSKTNPYAEQFAYGKPFDPNAEYSSLSTMLEEWQILQPQVAKAFTQLTKEALSGDAPFPNPYPEQSFRGLVIFQMHHLGYELGQIGLYRKL